MGEEELRNRIEKDLQSLLKEEFTDNDKKNVVDVLELFKGELIGHHGKDFILIVNDIVNDKVVANIPVREIDKKMKNIKTNLQEIDNDIKSFLSDALFENAFSEKLKGEIGQLLLDLKEDNESIDVIAKIFNRICAITSNSNMVSKFNSYELGSLLEKLKIGNEYFSIIQKNIDKNATMGFPEAIDNSTKSFLMNLKEAISSKQIVILSEQVKQLNKDLQKASTSLETMKNDLQKSSVSLETIKKELNSYKIEVITVIAIFSAVVFAFTGGLSLIGNAFNVLSRVNEIEVLLMTSIAGFILFNVIFGLLIVVFDITYKSDEEKHLNHKGWIIIIEAALGVLIAIFGIFQYFKIF